MPTDRRAPELIFHIGHHKTGSTAIQKVLAAGGLRIEGKRILYPCQGNHNYLYRHVHAWLDGGRIAPGTPDRPGLAAIGRSIAETDCDYVVLSGEEFEGADPAGLKKVIETFFAPHVGDYSVLCYVRPHAARTLSNFAEQTKTGLFFGDPEESHNRAIDSGRFQYARNLGRWFQDMDGRFLLRAMRPASLRGGSVVEDFAHAAFPAEAGRISIDTNLVANESLCIEDLLIIRIVQQELRKRGRGMRIMMGWEFARLLAAEEGLSQRTKPALHRSLAERIRRDYLEDARALDARYFADDPVFVRELDLAVEKAIPVAQSWRPEDYFSTDMLRSIRAMARLIGEMAENKSGNWAEFLRTIRHKTEKSPRRCKPAPAAAGEEAGTGARPARGPASLRRRLGRVVSRFRAG